MTVRLSIFYGFLFLSIGVFVPFWPVWLQSQDLSAGDIGLLLGSGTVLKIIGSPIIARLVDRSGARRKAIIILSLLSLAAVALFFVAEGYLALFAATVILAFFFSPLVPLSDNLTLMAAASGKVDYGRVRLWGSVAYAVAAILGGIWLQGKSEDWILWLVFGTTALIFASSLLLPKVATSAVKATSQSQMSPVPPMPILPLLRSRIFWMFLLGAGLAQGSHVMFYGFSTIHWQSVGISREVIGYLWAIGVVAEIILFAYATATMKKVDPLTLILIGAAAGVVRWALTGWTDDLTFLFVLQALHGITFGAAHLGAMYFLARAIPPGLSASAQSLYSSVSLGLIFAVAMPTAGLLYAELSGQAFYAMAIMSGLGFVIIAGLSRFWNRGELEVSQT
ncbi:MAG: 3-phenylpropionate MFS transporter [Alphaproteobacteria bacterium]|nr:3-phenylpropionate MFS transporter [Alphaproteobacteria bacterium]MBT4966987.1 3-phenylpropionate MFS transporter [Alphaproteobacteria bacterium]MBT5160505.1 3-phenylpropionate MFS transporter [Alphaproteobacteria bacterium]MBT5919788.1 3-phenylpropionate MFS transporter [Alphaproteobacteria bacterium]MBT6385506.1 3-phenylpropionate MFS transporter [Alphaproteobacteria bacterium]